MNKPLKSLLRSAFVAPGHRAIATAGGRILLPLEKIIRYKNEKFLAMKRCFVGMLDLSTPLASTIVCDGPTRKHYFDYYSTTALLLLREISKHMIGSMPKYNLNPSPFQNSAHIYLDYRDFYIEPGMGF